MFVSSWDKVRHLSADVILKFPRPLPGFNTPTSLIALVEFAGYLTGSARQRESDAGAQIIRVLFEIYCVDLRWELLFDKSRSSSTLTSCSPALRFFSNLMDSLEARLEKAKFILCCTDSAVERNEDPKADDFPLCHGLILGLRYSLSSAVKFANTCDHDEREQWLQLFRRCLALSFRGIEIGVSVVAEAPSDVDFSPHLASLGPVNANSYLFLNTNSFVGATSLDDATMDEAGNKELQRAVVGAWLLVKEASAMLSRLVDASVRLLHDAKLSFLENKDTDAIGSCFVDSLCRLKHMGAISEVHNSLQKTSEILLRHGFYDPELCGLPLKWLRVLLDKLENELQVFILRRSSGFAYSFLSLLRAEVSDSKPYMLSIVMDALLNSSEAMKSNEEDFGESWRKCVHALNITRLIILDASVSGNIDPYIERIAQIAVNGFNSKRWAIRNSSMMVFSAIVQRAVANEKNDFANKHSCTPSDFFTNFPNLLPFLLQALRSALGHGMDFEVNLDMLFPVLLLLAKLRPETVALKEMSTKELVGVDSFVPFIEACSAMENMHLRTISAKAFKSITPLQLYPSTMKVKLDKLCEGLAELNMNSIHGQLLFIRELQISLGVNSPQLESFPMLRAEILEAFTTLVLPSLQQVVETFCSHSPIMRCPPIVIVTINILELASLNHSSILLKRLLWTLCSRSYELYLIDEPRLMASPQCPLLMKSCVEHLLTLSFDEDFCLNNNLDMQKGADDLVAGLESPIAEIRGGVLDGLYKVFRRSQSQKIDTNKIMSSLLRCFSAEKQAFLREACLATLCSLSRRQDLASMNDEFIQEYVNQLDKLSGCLFGDSSTYFGVNGFVGDCEGISMYLKSSNTALYAFELLGWYCNYVSSTKIIADFVDLLSICSKDEAQLQGATAAIWLSIFHLISEKKDFDLELCLKLRVRMCLIALNLLQDDAEDVRVLMVNQLNKASLWDESYVPSVEGYTVTKLSGYLSKIVSEALFHSSENCTLSVIEEVFDYYFSHMRGAHGILQLHGSPFNLSKIFEEEAANLFRESLVVFDAIVPAISCIFRTLIRRGDAWGIQVGVDTFIGLLSKGVKAVATYDHLKENMSWIGDISFHENVFEQLYASIVLIRESVPLISHHLNSSVKDELTNYENSLQKLMDNQLLHPLIQRI